EFYQEMWRSLEEQDYWCGEIWNRRKNGEILPQLQSIRLIRDENGFVTYSVAIFSDISLLKRSQSELSFLAHYDPLTNLSNRLLLHEHIKLSLRRAIQSKTQAALFIVDLDHFKNINESLGHSQGDELLKAAAERLSQFMENNATLSRFGGDEFAVVFDNVNSAAEAATLAQQILTLFDTAFIVDSNEIFITASIGICLFPMSGKSSEEVFRNADTALSKAKAIGRATFAFYTSELTDQAYQRLRIASELRYALENNQLRVFFQPVYSLSKERIVGCEALVRWMHPERGMIAPADFIPIAEDSGLITNIDSWVLNTSCQQMKAWLDAGLDLKFVAVNVSSRLFSRIDFTEKVVEALSDSQLDPSYLELEITESAVMDDVERADSLLNKLCDMNVRLALDDFGTGFSSLNRLKSLPVHKLKIDQSFVRHLPSDGSDAAIVRAIIALGFSMQLEIQAEGIETLEQAEFLRQSNCVLAQGYFFGRPMPAAEFEQLIS
ncbi:MAG: EAL domain-containing protein, partial [Gammaproteobacteria bacterium]|nr:EAL domain-containing protein [Gammaproteobacteria bacterium]